MSNILNISANIQRKSKLKNQTIYFNRWIDRNIKFKQIQKLIQKIGYAHQIIEISI